MGMKKKLYKMSFWGLFTGLLILCTISLNIAYLSSSPNNSTGVFAQLPPRPGKPRPPKPGKPERPKPSELEKPEPARLEKPEPTKPEKPKAKPKPPVPAKPRR